MTAAEALAELKFLCSPDTTPTLTDGELEAILGRVKAVDYEGRTIDHDDWEETYDLNLAAQRAWQMKAGKATALVNFSSDGERYDRESIHKHCLTMANEYARKRMANLNADPRSTKGLLPWQIANGPECY